MNELQNKTNFLQPNNLQEAMQYAEIISKSSLVPSQYKNKPGDVLVAMQMGSELGMQSMQSLQNIAVINGRPSVWGDALLAICQSSIACEYIKETFDKNKMVATCTSKRKGHPEVIRTFSKEDAVLSKLWGKQGPWTQYPNRMLQMRARGFSLRDTFAAELKGMPLSEEVQDYQPEKDITPTPESKPIDAPTLQEYPADRFKDSYPGWFKLIEDGKATSLKLIEKISKNFILTKKQTDDINDIEKTIADEKNASIKAEETPAKENSPDVFDPDMPDDDTTAFE